LIVVGRPLDDVHIVLDGELSVRTGAGLEFAKAGVGDILGEMSLVDSRPPSASVVAIKDTLVLSVAKAAILRKAESDAGFGARFYRAIAIFLSERMRSAVSRLGYGQLPEDKGSDQDELDSNVLDNVHLAGARFERLLRRLTG
jgi:CRP-like cAMP-binding protein